MQPKIWGPDVWRSMHYIALGYPEHHPSLDVRQAFATFFEVLGTVLPCGKCSQHYAENLMQSPVADAMNDRASLFGWTVDLHNKVNASNGKMPWSYDRAYLEYASRSEPKQDHTDGTRTRTRKVAFQTGTFIICVVLSVGMIVWLSKRKRSRRQLTV